jgi:hypothetical protein
MLIVDSIDDQAKTGLKPLAPRSTLRRERRFRPLQNALPVRPRSIETRMGFSTHATISVIDPNAMQLIPSVMGG